MLAYHAGQHPRTEQMHTQGRIYPSLTNTRDWLSRICDPTTQVPTNIARQSPPIHQIPSPSAYFGTFYIARRLMLVNRRRQRKTLHANNRRSDVQQANQQRYAYASQQQAYAQQAEAQRQQQQWTAYRDPRGGGTVWEGPNVDPQVARCGQLANAL